MDILQISLLALSALPIVVTVLPLLKWDYWWVRVWDFPRLQISLIQIVLIISLVAVFEWTIGWWTIVLVLLFSCLIFQMTRIFRYTAVFPVQVKKFKGEPDDNTVSLLICNVLQSNRGADKLLKIINRENPDIVLTLETNSWWGEQLKPLENDYKFTVKVPLENRYGMHLYSKFNIKEHRIKYLLSDEVPSIHGTFELPSGQPVRFFCLHPKPPSPTESGSSTNRDGELLMVAKAVKRKDVSTLVFGDLNDVAWSRSTSMFQKVSGLLDPRIGRGFYNTFHAQHRFMRWPLDHIFHTDDFSLVKIRRLESMGSDHFPIGAILHWNPSAESRQDEPEADGEEKEDANEKIEKAKNGSNGSGS